MSDSSTRSDHTCTFRNLDLTKVLQADDYYFSFFLRFSTCKVKIMWYILSHKDIELYLKAVFQVPWLLKNTKYIKVHIITAILWFQQCVSLIFFSLRMENQRWQCCL